MPEGPPSSPESGHLNVSPRFGNSTVVNIALAPRSNSPRSSVSFEDSLLAVAQPPVNRTQHVGIIVGPDKLLFVGFSLGPDVRGSQLADVGLLARRDHDRSREDVFVVAARILAVDPALHVVGFGNA